MSTKVGYAMFKSGYEMWCQVRPAKVGLCIIIIHMLKTIIAFNFKDETLKSNVKEV